VSRPSYHPRQRKELLLGDLTWKRLPALRNDACPSLRRYAQEDLSINPLKPYGPSLWGRTKSTSSLFFATPGPPTNNQAEQSIRFLVIFRKIMFGTRSEKGLRTHSILPSLVLTSLRQGHKPREFLEILLVSDTKTAQRALYRNSS